MIGRVVVALAALVACGCGVTSEREPRPIEDSPVQQAPATPSVSTESSPPPTSSSTVPPSTTATTPLPKR
jgi:hypothetical protein